MFAASVPLSGPVIAGVPDQHTNFVDWNPHMPGRSNKLASASTLQPLLDIDDVAALFNCNRRTVWTMVRDGRLPAVRVGTHWRIRPEDVHAYITGGAR